ncbi:MAG: helix-turn-helix domain-containing protein [Bacteroidota bacterium]
MIERVKKLLEIEQLSSSQFADEIKLQRSSLSHVLSGRNKPSLDFVMKIKKRFPEVNLDWLIFGKGHMFLSQQEKKVTSPPAPKPEIEFENSQKTIEFDTIPEANLISSPPKIELPSINIESKSQNTLTKKAKKVMIFYGDGTFEEFVGVK